VMALASTARAYQTVKNGKPWAPVWDRTMVLWNALMVPKNSPNKDEAMKFIAFVAKDPQQKKFSELETVGPINERVKPDLNEAQKKINAFAPERRSTNVYINNNWWSTNHEMVNQKWQAWTAG
jgi:putative spermidine/putrescine transport system substrate-binding protein